MNLLQPMLRGSPRLILGLAPQQEGYPFKPYLELVVRQSIPHPEVPAPSRASKDAPQFAVFAP